MFALAPVALLRQQIVQHLLRLLSILLQLLPALVQRLQARLSLIHIS